MNSDKRGNRVLKKINHSDKILNKSNALWEEVTFSLPDEYEEKFKLVFENAPLGIALINPSWKIIDANIKFCEILEYSYQEIIRTDIRRITYSADLDSTFQLMNKIENGETDSYELKKRYIKSTGELITVQIHSASIRNKFRELLYSVLMVQDLTKEERRDEELRLLEHSINSISEMVSITDQEDRFTFVNKAFIKKYGYSEEELLGKKPGMLRQGLENPEISKEKRWKGELINKTKDGEIFNITLETSEVENNDGKMVGHIGIAKDVSEQLKIEEKLKKLSKVVEQNPAVIIITDKKGLIEYVNPKFIEITGYSEDEVRGKNPRFLKSGNKSPKEYEELWHTILSGEEWRGELINRKKDGEFFYEYAIISPIKDSRGNITHFVAVKEDITAKKKTEENMRRAENFAVLGRMTGYLSHEIKTPLTAIKLNVEMLSEKLKGEKAYSRSFQIIEKELKRLNKLLKDVLQFSKEKENLFCDISLRELLEQVMDLLKPVFREKNITILNNIGPELIKGDAGELKTVLHQLIENSIDAIDRNGFLEFRSVKDIKKQMLRIIIRDTGCGIKSSLKIFEPFYTTKQSGTGMGLTIIQKIIEKHQGKISLIFSEPGNTIFQISLPLLQ